MSSHETLGRMTLITTEKVIRGKNVRESLGGGVMSGLRKFQTFVYITHVCKFLRVTICKLSCDTYICSF